MRIIYVYDALCGWCYGFSPVMTQFEAKYKDSLNFEVLSGGMITGERIGPIGEVAPYISWAYKEVEQATGVRFGDKFLNHTLKDGKAIFTSIPPAVALSLFKHLQPQKVVHFASELQKAIYFEGIEPENLSAYGQIAAKFGINPDDFVSKMHEDFYTKAAEADFKKSATLTVNGFPTILLERNGVYHIIGNGYMSLKTLENNYLTAKNK